MDTTFISVLNMSAYLIYFMLPAYLANAGALAFGGGKPLDSGLNFRDGRRIFGDGVTWRGTIIGTGIGILVGFIQGLISGNILYGIILGLFLGGGALIGDAGGSFVKRRMNIKRGHPTPFLDQLDFVIGALVFASIVIILPFYMIILILIISFILHLIANILAHLFGIKKVWY